jgi:hypothetical protein
MQTTALYGTYKSGIVELEEEPVETQEGNRVMVIFFEKPKKDMDFEDFLKLKGKYAGKISVEKFLEQKHKDLELER